MTDTAALLLIVAFRHVISEPTIEAGYAQFAGLCEQPATYEAFCDAVADCLREGWIREPIRLPEGALQCHWHLELTPDGVQSARGLLQKDAGRASQRG